MTDLALVGGDVSGGDRFVATVAIVGRVATGTALLRSGATPGDSLYVSGSLGGSLLGLQMLLGQQTPDASHPAVQRHCEPTPRLALGQALRRVPATACDRPQRWPCGRRAPLSECQRRRSRDRIVGAAPFPGGRCRRGVAFRGGVRIAIHSRSRQCAAWKHRGHSDRPSRARIRSLAPVGWRTTAPQGDGIRAFLGACRAGSHVEQRVHVAIEFVTRGCQRDKNEHDRRSEQGDRPDCEACREQ